MIRLSVNGAARSFRGHPFTRLIDVLREAFGLTGTKEGCGEGECGACSVLIDDEVAAACLVPVCQVDGSSVRTVEGLAGTGDLSPLQAAFLETGGAQCGICTPGMVLAAANLLERCPNPSEAEIREGLAGNICRCTGYMKIFDSVRRAAEMGGRA